MGGSHLKADDYNTDRSKQTFQALSLTHNLFININIIKQRGSSSSLLDDISTYADAAESL